MIISKQEEDYIERATRAGIKIAEIAMIIMINRTRTAPTLYDKNSHGPAQTQEEFTILKIEINKILAKL